MMKQKQLFHPKEVSKDQLANILRRPAAKTQYIIHFTARSGSGWLTELATKAGHLGKPGESFNPTFVANIARKFNAGSIDDYVAALTRRRVKDGVFGCKATYGHLIHSFGDEETFVRHFESASHLWLLREDIVLQAVSLMKLRQTKIAHKMDADQAALRAADDKFTYSEGEMNLWLKRLLTTERGSEALFARFGLTPLRLSYEQITTAPPQQTITAFARHVGLPDLQLTDLATAQGKIGSDKNQEFANRFRESNAELIKRMDHERALRVAAVRMTAH